MELRDKVVLSDDDIKMVEEFFQHYNDPKTNNLIMTARLRGEINKFKEKAAIGGISVEDQRNFTVALCEALRNTTHPLLRDEAIKDVISACDQVFTDAKFYEEFEKAIQEPPQETKEEG
jgi:hypothetical protein